MTESNPERANLTPAQNPDKPVKTAAEFLALCPSGSLLGLDPGTHTIGLAGCDATRLVVTPLATIRRTKWRDDLTQIQAVATKREVTGLVLGYPLNMDESEGPRAQSARQMGNNLVRGLGLPVLLWDERLTSEEASEIMEARGIRPADRPGVIDSIAAEVILQDALRAFERQLKG